MDKKTAQLLIEDTFNDSFNEERFTIFAKNLLNDIEPKSNFYTGNLIWEDYKEHINTYKRIGKYIDPEGEALDVLIVEVKSVTKLERARTVLRNFVIKHLSKFEKDYALVAFYSKEDNGNDWRFSFIKLEYRSELDEEKGKVKLKKEFTPAKRYSFLVGKYEKAHTAKNQLLPLLQNIANNPTVEELEAAFSIEKVTHEFFQQYKDLYIKLFEHFENDSHIKAELDKADIDNARFTKKLLGQIVFLYFLQKKGWLGVAQNERWGNGKKRFVQELFDQAHNKSINFFKDKLQYLFYEALAKERNNVNSYYERFKCRIPFLNGGLFEADYDWRNANITIPENLFRNEEKNKSGDIGTGVLDVFDRYNFTIKEDEPLDKEVAVDPEMLGKVFENMLDITERKSKGAFYTPREIVHYMCQESLIHYLDNALNSGTNSYQELGKDQTALFGGSTDKKGNLKLELEHSGNIRVPKKDIEAFIREGHFALENDQRVAAKGETKTYQYQLPESIRKNADLIGQKLTEIRICDPAIGSGAFPVGLLHELVNAMLVLKPHFSYDYLNKKLEGFNIPYKESYSESRYIYRLKRHIIQESIYGVDIDASAIDIARLRLWLSLVVDEDDLDPIETLPNLDYKIVCGNSLIGLPDGAMRNLQVEAELETLKEQFYNITDDTKKKALRQEINSKIRELLDSAEQFAGYKIDFDFKLFFSEVWREKGGFDVVIGNPPYGVSIKGEYRKTVLKQFEKVPDFEIYYFFIELSYNLLHRKGCNTFIIPNSILFNVYAENYRIKILDKWQVNEILDCTNFKFFESAVVRNIIYNWSKGTSNSPISIGYRNTYDSNSFVNLIARPRIPISKQELQAFNQNWGLAFKLDPKTIEVIKRIKSQESTTDDLFEISQGYIPYRRSDLTKTYGNIKGNSIVDNREWHSDEKLTEEYQQEIQGRNLSKYNYAKAESFVWYGKHLAGYIEPKFFNKKRLLIREITNPAIIACIVKEHLVNDPQIISIINKDNSEFSLVWLWCIFNSTLATFYHFNASPKATKGEFPKILVTDIRNFPLPKYKSELLPLLKRLRNYCIFSNSKNDLIEKFFFELINGVIFELYFPSELKSAGKEILKHLENLKPITDDMSEEEKLAIIQSEFERLYDPNHPVRFAIETLDSVEEVRIIKEALK